MFNPRQVSTISNLMKNNFSRLVAVLKHCLLVLLPFFRSYSLISTARILNKAISKE